ncbi:hypothetical protein GCM10017600_79240 [Streptosporangium carneum]|uniref:Uncharacterized protein n=2 Tax=Streptosporangium carneum TaxID=47481 RepID=A0A9W6I9Z3_9ACTN|nr:hypothetical protein GCM10017600_79240 [Streptosporangium carneum]
MSSQFGLTSMRLGMPLSHGRHVVLSADPAARLRRETQLQQDIQVQQDIQLQQRQSARTQVLASRLPIAFAATGVEAVPAPEAGGYAPTKHTANGGWRGPHPWRRPPVII